MYMFCTCQYCGVKFVLIFFGKKYVLILLNLKFDCFKHEKLQIKELWVQVFYLLKCELSFS
jgi:hypothetical protein